VGDVLLSVFLAGLVVLAVLTAHFSRRGGDAMALWGWGWVCLVATGALGLLGEQRPVAGVAAQFLAPLHPSFMLAGALAHSGSRAGRWIPPVAFGLGMLRLALALGGDPGPWLAVGEVPEFLADLAAAGIALRVALRGPGPRVRHLLAPAFVGMAFLEALSAWTGLAAGGGPATDLPAWLVVGPVALCVQIALEDARKQVLHRGRERRAEIALRDSEGRFRGLADHSFDLVAEIDAEGRYSYTNPRYEEMLGHPAGSLIGTRSLELTHPDDREPAIAWFRALVAGSDARLLLVRLREASGGWRWFESAGRVFRGPDGTRRIVATSRDVTERMERRESARRNREELEERVRQRTAELRESEERYRAVSELSSDLAFALRVAPDGTVTREWVTEAHRRILGYEPPDPADVPGWLALVHPEDEARAAETLEAAARGETREVEVRVRTQDGGYRWLRVRMASAGVTADGTRRVLGVSQDVTDRRQVEEERRRLESHMQQIERLESLGVLAGGVAHDFNNLLAVILGQTALALADAPVGSDLARRLESVRSAARHAEALAGQMLAYAGNVPVARKPLDLARLVEEMRDLLDASLPPGCSLDTDVVPGSAVVDGDETQLRQVVLNLVSNASETMAGSGRIALRTGIVTADAGYLQDAYGRLDLASGDYACLEVTDTGAGMEEATRARIFEPFFSTKFTGRGLGLAAVLGIVRAHGGAIKLATEVGRGTTFRVLLPLSAGAPEPATPRHPAPGDRAGATILVVDDEAPVRELLCEFLERAGFAVLTAPGGAEALEILRSRGREIDAAVLDLAMPGLDGGSTVEALRGLRPDLPVLLVTGFSQDALGTRLPPSGVAGILRKPFEPEELVAALRNVLG
jgi:PAS domain S-box-containing protein